MKTGRRHDPAARKSLDDIERPGYRPAATPWDAPAIDIALEKGEAFHAESPTVVCLDGAWELAEGGTEAKRIKHPWPDSILARVPGSIHSALHENKRLPDPTFGTNQKTAREASFKTWWMRRHFRSSPMPGKSILKFGGIANVCTIWLNGKCLGRHEGMFGGPEFDVSEILEPENSLAVKLDPIPFIPSQKTPNNPDNNLSWRQTVVINNVYGWHYSNLPSLGIWRSVEIHSRSTVSIDHLFVRTRDIRKGTVEAYLRFNSKCGEWKGKLKGTIEGETFTGPRLSFTTAVQSNKPCRDLILRFQIPEPRLWWPVDLGLPHLYSLQLTFIPEHTSNPVREVVPDHKRTTFGLRTIEMAPLPDGPDPEKYNWTFVINGSPIFVKGTGWCTMDALLDFSRSRYEHFLNHAVSQHVQFLRAWGSGMPETDDFYDLCDRKGIMVLQEWPTAWNSHRLQPYEILEETVRVNTLRLRNHPSLVMWGGGNESWEPFGKAIDMMGRLSMELDGTRPFHRGEPWGGSVHSYECYWGWKHLNHNLTLEADFIGEFGLASMPIAESVQRYLPEDEKNTWPPTPNGAFAYHTPVFNTQEDLTRLLQYAGYFVKPEISMKDFITGSQLAQAIGYRHTLERARSRWPDCSGALYYKLNDNYPSATWSTVDWFGAPKIAHYFCQDAFSPLHACVLFSALSFADAPAELPVYLLDDMDSLATAEWVISIRAVNQQLEEMKSARYAGSGSIRSPMHLGDFSLTRGETRSEPLFVIAEIHSNGSLQDRTFYFANFEGKKGCLFDLPRTTLTHSVRDDSVMVVNTGPLPAVGVCVDRPGSADSFVASDNYFWLDRGEEKVVEVSDHEDISVTAWNSTVDR